MLLEGGPRDKWCYYVEDIEQQQRAADHIGYSLDYERTEDMLAHPVNGVICRVWRWVPPRRFT